MTEGIALGAVGGVLGLGAAWAGLGFLRRALPASLPRTDTLELGGPVLVFGLGLALLSGVLCGALPALRGMRRSPLGNWPPAAAAHTSVGSTGPCEPWSPPKSRWP